MLNGKTAVVTGAGRNIGKGIAQVYANQGASVAINDLERDRCQTAVESLSRDENQHHLAIPGDVTDPSKLQKIAERLEAKYGTIDILVNNLGYAVNKDVFTTSIEEWDAVHDLTLKSTFLCTKYIGPLMTGSADSAIINMASGLGHEAQHEKVAYCAAKGGVINMTRQLALDLAEYNIRVNSISPGRVGDPVGVETGSDARNADGIPLGRVGVPGDIGHTALFLASEFGSYITGADIKVDGGLSL